MGVGGWPIKQCHHFSTTEGNLTMESDDAVAFSPRTSGAHVTKPGGSAASVCGPTHIAVAKTLSRQPISGRSCAWPTSAV
mmetsp:Transcript_29021/g.72362  ORF Transcript_29021/g.72362 Transcript_29021/m.72362 type:complete len:80 (-) Transcript_29021:584-823(-)